MKKLLPVVGVYVTLSVIVFCVIYILWGIITEVNYNCLGTSKAGRAIKECDEFPYRTLALAPLIGVPLTYAFFKLKDKI